MTQLGPTFHDESGRPHPPEIVIANLWRERRSSKRHAAFAFFAWTVVFPTLLWLIREEARLGQSGWGLFNSFVAVFQTFTLFNLINAVRQLLRSQDELMYQLRRLVRATGSAWLGEL